MTTITVIPPGKGVGVDVQVSGLVGVGISITINTNPTSNNWRCFKRSNCTLSSYNNVHGTTITLTPQNTYPGTKSFFASFTTDSSAANTLPAPPDQPYFFDGLDDESDTTTYEKISRQTTVFGALQNSSTSNTYGLEIYNGNGDILIDLSSSLFRYVLSGSTTIDYNETTYIQVPGVNWHDGTWMHIVTPGSGSGTAVNALTLVRRIDSINGGDGGLKLTNLRDELITIGYWVFRV